MMLQHDALAVAGSSIALESLCCSMMFLLLLFFHRLCRKSLPFPLERHSSMQEKSYPWSWVSLYGPDFSGMGECKKNSVGGGKNVPVLTAGFYIVGNTFFRCEGKKGKSLFNSVQVALLYITENTTPLTEHFSVYL
jgi:hypothetical protein